MRIIRNSLLILLGLILAIIIPITATIQSFNNTVIKPNTITSYFGQIGLYEEIEGLVKDVFNESTEDLQEISKIEKIIQSTLNEHLTEGLIASKVRELENSFWDYLLDKTDTVSPIYFGDFKNNVITSLEKELDNLAREEGLPANLIKENVTKNVEANIPESFDIVSFLDISNDELSSIKYYYQKEQDATIYLYLMIGILILLGLVVSFNLRRFTKWIGLTFITAGVFLLIPAAFTYFFLNKLLINRITFEGVSVKLQASFKAFMEMMTGDTTIFMMYLASGILFIGVIALIIGSLTKKSASNTEAR